MQDFEGLFTPGRALPSSWHVEKVIEAEPHGSRGAARSAQPVRRRWFGRSEPTLFQRCLAVHMFYAGPQSHLS